MKKFYNILFLIIFLAILTVVALIIMKYENNYRNEKEIQKVISTITAEKEFHQETTTKATEEVIETKAEYKGHKIIGIIKIPIIELEYPILEKTTEETMKLSITQFFGNGVNQIGNLSLAGHNNYDGTMFGKTKNLGIGDTIELTDMKKITKEYKIYKIFKTDPNDTSVIEAEEFGTREVTLITCSNGNKERLIIKAREIL